VLLLILVCVAIFRAVSSTATATATASRPSSYDDHESTLKEELAILNELGRQFSRVQTESDAIAAAGPVRASVERLISLKQRAKALPPLTGSEKTRLRGQYQPVISASLATWRSQIHRLKFVPGVPEALGDVVNTALSAP
jgi:hypothetical protein